MSKKKVYMLLMMAGKGNRFGAKIPKQFVKVKDEPIFIYLLKQLHNIKKIDEIIIITNPNYYKETINWIEEYKIKKISSVISGGNGRSRDIKEGLKEIKNASDDDIVLIYDATHPIVDYDGVNEVIETLYDYDVATLAEYQFDTTYKIDKDSDIIVGVTNREEMIAGASPEGFKYKKITDIFFNSTDEQLQKATSAGAIALTNNLKMKAVKMKVMNLKITYIADYDNFLKIIDNERRK